MLISVSLFLLVIFLEIFQNSYGWRNHQPEKKQPGKQAKWLFVGYFTMAGIAGSNHRRLKNGIKSVPHPLSARLYRLLNPFCHLLQTSWLLTGKVNSFSCHTCVKEFRVIFFRLAYFWVYFPYLWLLWYMLK